MKKPTKLKLALVMKGITQEWLSEKTGISPTSISRIVNGTIPSLRNAQKIARALGMTVEELWPLEDEHND